MEASISSFCSSLSAVLLHADSSSRALSDAVSRRPIPLDSASSAFLQGLDRRAAAAGSDLGLLESMAFGTVSFEELLGHCNEVLKLAARHSAALESRLSSFGYVPEVEVEMEGEGGDVDKFVSPGTGCGGGGGGSVSVARSGRKRFEDDDALFEDSMSLQNLGFSDACLATLSSEGNDCFGSPKKFPKQLASVDEIQSNGKEAESKSPQNDMNAQDGSAFKGMIKASKQEYDQLPPYMKTLASWEELEEAIAKLNLYFCSDKAQGNGALNQDDVGTIGLGRKGRSYLLILLRLNQLVMETFDGSIFYRLRKSDS